MSDRADRIEKRGTDYLVLSKAGEVLGTHESEAAAQRQLAAVEASKAREGNDRGDEGSVWRYDDVELRMDSHTVDPETGWMRVEAVIGRGDVVLPYLNSDGSIRREFRPSSEVFSPESMASFDGVPLTNNHPPVHLDDQTTSRFQVGSISTPRREGNLLVANVLVTDAGMVKDILGGKRQLSPGYRVNPDVNPGEFRGGRFDLTQRRIEGNHVAGVDQGRQGREVSLRMDSGDAVLATTHKEARVAGEDDKNKPKTVTVRIDGQDIETDEATAAVLTDMEEKRKATTLELAESKAKRADTDAKLEALQSKVEGLTSKPEPENVPSTDARLDALEAAHKAEIKRIEDQSRDDMAELQLRLDVVATAKSMIPDFVSTKVTDSGDANKTRSDVQIEVIGSVLGKDEADKVAKKNDAGYTEAFYEQAIATGAKRKDHGSRLLKLASGSSTETRKDEAGEALKESNERHRTAHTRTKSA